MAKFEILPMPQQQKAKSEKYEILPMKQQSKEVPLEQSPLGNLARNAYSAITPALETAAGGVGDVIGGATNLLNYGLTSLGANPKHLPEAPPLGSQAIRENITNPIKEKLFPNTHFEPTHWLAEGIGDVGSFLSSVYTNPLAGSLKAVSPLRKLGNAILGESGSQLAGLFTDNEIAKAGGRLAATALFSRLGGRSIATKTMEKSYDLARNAITGRDISKSAAARLNRGAVNFEKDLGKRITTNEGELRGIIKKIKNLTQSAKPRLVVSPREYTQEQRLKSQGKELPHYKSTTINPVPVDDIWTIKKDLNNLYGNLKNKNTVEAKLIGKQINLVNKTLQQTGVSIPEFGKNFNLGEEIFQGLNASDEISKFVREKFSLSSIASKPLTKLLLWGLTPGKAIGSIGGALGVRELYKYRDLLESPTAQKIYSDLLRGALEQNSAMVIKNASKMDKLVDHYEKKNK